jgi:hypothetical protein
MDTAKVAKLIPEMQREMLVRSQLESRVQLKERCEISVHVVFVLLDVVFVQAVHGCYLDSSDQVNEVAES